MGSVIKEQADKKVIEQADKKIIEQADKKIVLLKHRQCY